MPGEAEDADRENATEEGLTHHGGAPPRGLAAVPVSPLFEGRFGRMFRNLPIPVPPREALIALGRALPEASGSGARSRPPTPTSASSWTTT
jgi:hypothetical protein